MKIVALVAFRDEERFLPGLLKNLENKVDGIVFLDDQSSDSSNSIVTGHPKTLEVIRIPKGTWGKNEDGLIRHALISRGWNYDADWFLGLDADERLEINFRKKAEKLIARADKTGADACWLSFKELWSPHQFRVDGVWGQKRKAALFRSSRSHVFDMRRIHTFWASINPEREPWLESSLRIYHLRMINPEDRVIRMQNYLKLDPDLIHQPFGYSYLTDESNMKLKRVRFWNRYGESKLSKALWIISDSKRRRED